MNTDVIDSSLSIQKQELESLLTIYPELEINDDFNICKISIPIVLENDITLILNNDGADESSKYSTSINHLPDIHLTIKLPLNYPINEPPIVILNNIESWLPNSVKLKILNDLNLIWETFHDSIIYNYIDYIKSNSEIGFGISNNLMINNLNFNYLKNENDLQILKKFNNTYFNCEICQSNYKGFNIIKFPNCNDTFCKFCLKNYFSHIINNGEIENIHCPSFNCTKIFQNKKKKLINEIENNLITDFNKFNQDFFKLPIEKSIMLKIFKNENENEGENDENIKLIEKFEILFNKEKMEQYKIFFPNRISECPRNMCSTTFIKLNPNSKLSICTKCKFAFCNDCFHSWHGYINPCSIFLKKIPISIILEFLNHNGNESINKQSIEDKRVISNINFKYGRKIVELSVNDYIAESLFNELIKSGNANIIKCPNCLTFIQKSDGCNKMTCLKCKVFFCNLCGDRLDRNDPYDHYNNPMNSCFGKLFQGMVVDGEIV
ncbi:translation termination inhibitor protein itt1 [Pichia californica]|uniref:RBR-type E3 ubiquitin transferase n=1 Tax=Pichia californica TaxID=460514 RepID=A0A9P6WP51_9ASCO|nr:translation termination inhibitor protein itt1 [[Candida] californica]KAG0690714.1 translation termination inhibitor protein itt1 [[Candida] californica]